MKNMHVTSLEHPQHPPSTHVVNTRALLFTPLFTTPHTPPQSYQESTDGSFIETKASALVWHYRDADPDFGHWQAKELLDHLEGVLSNQPVEVASGQAIVEVKPQVRRCCVLRDRVWCLTQLSLSYWTLVVGVPEVDSAMRAGGVQGRGGGAYSL